MKQNFSRWLPAWLALLLFGVGTITAPADIWRKLNTGSGTDGRVLYNEVEDEMLLVFQNGVTSDTTFYLTTGPNTTGNGASELGAAPLSEQGNMNQVFQVEWVSSRAGTANVTGCSNNVFYLKAYSTGLYVTTQHTLSQGAPILYDYLVFTEDKTQATEFCFASAGMGTYQQGSLARSNREDGGGAATIFGAGQYNLWNNAIQRTAVAIAYNPDRGQLGGRWTSIEADINVYVNYGAGHNNIIQLNPWGGTRSWFAYNVEIVTGKQILSALLDQYRANGNTPAVYQGGTAPGYYDATAAGAFASAWVAIEEAIASSETPSDADIENLRNNLSLALANVQTTQVGISEGYYSLVSADSALTATAALTGGTQLNAATGLTRADYDATNAQQLFRITAADHGYYVQNAATGYYINQPGSLTNSLEAATVQTFTKLAAAGQFAMGNSTSASSYYAATETGLSVAATSAPNSATAWRLQPVDSTTAAQLIAASEPLRAQLAMQRLISEAQARVAATDTVVALNPDSYITEPSQLSTNAPEPTLPDQTVSMAIDGVLTTWFHTRWSAYSEGEAQPTEPHYLLADAGDDGFSGDVAFRAVRRRNADGTIFENSWPVEAWITASNDSVTWDTITAVNLGNEGVTEYISPIITLDQTYRYLKFSLIRHSQAGPNGNGQYAFCLAEFNWYEAEVSSTRSASLREDTKQQLADLKAAIATAQALSAPTEADVAVLQAALDAFNAVYPETGELEAEIEAAQNLHDAAPINNGVSGYYNTADADILQTAINAAAAGDIGALLKSEIDQRLQDLKNAEFKFQWSYNVADSNKIYRVHFITNTAARTPAGYLYVVDDRYNTSKGYQVSADWSEDARDDADDAYYFTVKQVGDTAWVLQHVKTGYYIWNPITHSITNGYSITTSTNRDESHYVFHAVGDGTFIILPEGYDRYWFTKELNGTHYYTSTNLLASTNAFFFRLEPVADAKITMKRKVNDLQVLTLPYRTTAKPVGENNELINAYKVVGFVKDSDTGEVTDLKVTFLDSDEPTPSGTPIILETGSYGQYDPTSTDSVTFDCKIDTAQLDLALIDGTEVDATVGLQSTVAVDAGSGRLFFRNALLQPISGSVTLTRQTGYINLNDIVDTSDQYNPSDVTPIPVNGSIVGIGKTTLSKANEPVNVYTIDGVLVKKNVKAANATQGLSKGIYVVGKEKVLVK